MTELRDEAARILAKTLRDLDIRFRTQLPPDEREDIAQEAYAKVLAAEEGGAEVRAPLAMVRRSAINAAIDRLRLSSRNDVALTEFHPALARADADPAAQVLTRADLARGIEAAEQLPPKQQAVYRAAVIDGLSPSEACRQLAMRRSTFFKYRDQAIAHVQSAQLEGADTRFAGGEHKLLSAYALGLASARERARVRRLLRHDPQARVLLRELKRGHELAAGALPAVVISEDLHDAARGADRLAAVVGRLRDAVHDAAHRAARETTDAAALSGGGASRGAGAAGAGVLAKLTIGGGGSAAVACLVGGGALITCVAMGVLPNPIRMSTLQDSGAPARESSASTARTAPVPNLTELVQKTAASPAEKNPSTDDQRKASKGRARERSSTHGGITTGAESSVVSPAAPPAQQEFGVDAGATPVGGAPPDTNDADGASAATVRQEFGP
jgi:DNA-directed RNA polymerase specialized sigma24 family protein